MKRKSTVATLTKAEEEIMQIIWQLEPCLVKDIITHLADPDIPHSTVSSVVRILEKKGFVDHKAYGKTHEYFSIIGRETYAAHGVQSLMDKYFNSSPGKLVSFLIQKENLSLKEVADLMKSINAKPKKS